MAAAAAYVVPVHTSDDYSMQSIIDNVSHMLILYPYAHISRT